MTPSEITALHDDAFAPWVRALNLRCVAVEAACCRFVMPASPNLIRGGGEGGGVVSGQALAAAADTASVLALFALNGRLRPCTTVNITTHFMRPIPEGDVEILVEPLSNGRRMAVVRTSLKGVGATKTGATATCAFAYLEAA